MMKSIVFTDALKLRNMIEFALHNDCSDKLARDLLHLLVTVTNSMITYPEEESKPLEASPGHHTAVIGADFAAHSLAFAVFREAYVNITGGTCFMNGGFIYEGPGHAHDGGFPALTVSLSSSPDKHSWSVHT